MPSEVSELTHALSYCHIDYRNDRYIPHERIITEHCDLKRIMNYLVQGLSIGFDCGPQKETEPSTHTRTCVHAHTPLKQNLPELLLAHAMSSAFRF